jgi:hypothetical protein
MATANLRSADLLLVEDTLWVLTAPVGVAAYDFRFDLGFACRRPWERPDRITAVARVGAFTSYQDTYLSLGAEGIALVHSPEQHLRCSQLPHWYPLLEDLTPRSLWFEGEPDIAAITEHLGWPNFLKGARQTSRHRRRLSIVSGPEALREVLLEYQNDPILHWQPIVARQLIPLRPVEDPQPDRIPSSFEFRSFWWRGELVGLGRYWWEGRRYELSPAERDACLAVAGEAARRIAVPFLVVDLAQATDGRWIVIESNDAQESGYAGVPPLVLWRKVMEIERKRSVTD